MIKPALLASIALLAILLQASAATDDPHVIARQRLVDELAALGRAEAESPGSGGFDPRVLEVLRQVPRHEFVPAAEVRYAYENRPLPIGHGQTISQPYIVALMTELLRTKPAEAVLEIGTGSGYQAAVLARLTFSVHSIEIVEPLYREASARLKRLGYGNIFTRSGDGYYGWPEAAPFDAIIVTAAANHIPPPLIRQLKPGGRMVIPVGASFLTQHLVLVEKNADGGVTTRQLLPVRFVPLTGGH
jgi:protein-L-isoaspartate(D-aspartate) O-methyltransferase